MTYFIDNLQAVELPDETDGISVRVAPELDSMGFNTVTVVGETRESVVEYVRENWGDEDHAWFAKYVLGRIEVLPPDDIADAWRRFNKGGAGAVSRSELTRIDEWRDEIGLCDDEDDA